MAPLLFEVAPILHIDESAKFSSNELQIQKQLIAIGFVQTDNIFQIGQQFGIPLDYKISDYFELVALQENFWWGLEVPSNYSSHSKSNIEPRSHAKIDLSNDLQVLFEITKKRKSAEDFNSTPILTKKILEQLFITCFYRANNDRLPYGSAGGFSYLKLFFVTNGLENFSAGVYFINQTDRTWTSINCSLNVKELKKICFDQNIYENCHNFLIIAEDSKDAQKKYGSRARRFGLLAAGGVLDRMHLAATQINLKFRALGGFDEHLLMHSLATSDISGINVIMALG